MIRSAIAVLGLMSLAGPAAAAVVVLTNASDGPVAVAVKGGAAVELAVGETRAVPCGGAIEITYPAAGKPTAVRLEPDAAYVFVPKKGGLELHGIEMAGPPAAGPATPAATAKFLVPVRLFVDDAERRTKRVYEPVLRKRLAEASDILAAHTGVKFEVTHVGEWASDADAADLEAQRKAFEKAVKTDDPGLSIGFTSRRLPAAADVPLAVAGPALNRFVLVREGELKSEAERVELLVAQLGKFLGAVPSPDPMSAMRPRLGDGKALSVRFRVGFDPLNTLAMNVWAEQLREGKLRAAVEAGPAVQVRLARVYATIAAADPNYKLPDVYAGFVQRNGLVPEVAAPADVRPVPPRVVKQPDKPLSAKEEAIRRVVRSVTVRAEDNLRKPATGDGARVKGDELTALYVRTAADSALGEEKGLRETAFLVGLGVALDDSNVLRDNPLTAAVCRAVETDDERRRRVAVLGNPTVRFRRDLCQHFVVSAALAELVGPALAEQAGLAKEMIDMARPSGFSFADLAADFAGIEFAKRVKGRPTDLESISRGFKVTDFVPATDGLAEGLSAEKFRAAYGGLEDERFKAAVAAVRKRVGELGAYSGK